MRPERTSTDHIKIRTTPTELRDLADHLEVIQERKRLVRKGMSIPMDADDMTDHLLKTSFQCDGVNLQFVLND